MWHDVTIEDILDTDGSQRENDVFIDVRSETEYAEGTIPGAVNLPLFNNDERKIIGTVYTRESPKAAMEIGLEIASRKLPELYRQAEELCHRHRAILFCWRGGMRSKSLAVVLDLMGLSVMRLSGGYKAYRRYIIDYFSREFPFHIVVVRGNTGTGKTQILQELKKQGYPVIDLEALAHNRGSVFGYIGQEPQPPQKQFEAVLYDEIARCPADYLIVECESKRIGKVTLPQPLFAAMQDGTQILIHDSMANRARRLVTEYAGQEYIEELKLPLEKLKKRLGKETLNDLYALLDAKQYELFAERLILEYYDPLYGYPNEASCDYEHCVENSSIEKSLQSLTTFLNERFPRT